ncbi:SIR2 family protein [Aeromonas caviae]|uniref:SIR2 family protein n=1 Tax=Aeromonas caviae TaxID=648 RepID=UPI0029DB7142|nr:SIR2 family protein [Aeromonas caviae]MDX7790742.1 SIR2 family protein [Aeromonas caviae]
MLDKHNSLGQRERMLKAPPPPPMINAEELAVRYSGSTTWHPLDAKTYKRLTGKAELDSDDDEKLAINNNNVSSFLQRSLQLPNVALFAGSGTSLGDPKGPSMWDLWSSCMFKNGEYDPSQPCEAQMTEKSVEVCRQVNYTQLDAPNIEHFLSYCDAYLMVHWDDNIVDSFVTDVKATVLKCCSEFLNRKDSDISAYTTLLLKLAKRRVRDSRLKVFTTNYDMCFETAASNLGMITVDGFSYTRKRRFDGQFFNYDIVRRDGDVPSFIAGVIQLYKLHGSVSWERNDTSIFESSNVDPKKACLIYPAKGKYQQAFIQPHLELLSRFLEYLRQPNNCLIMSGFGFNDDHLSEPILSAVKSNPSLKLIVTDYSACSNISPARKYWNELSIAAENGFDITFINASFKDLGRLIPNLAALSPAEQLANSIRLTAKEIQ